jgi:hypothetical protein
MARLPTPFDFVFVARTMRFVRQVAVNIDTRVGPSTGAAQLSDPLVDVAPGFTRLFVRPVGRFTPPSPACAILRWN